jgi:hypothetical protein
MLMGFIALFVFFGSVGAPIALAVGFWKLARRSRSGWLFHVLFAPSVIVSEWAIICLLALSMGDNGDGPPGEGFLYVPAFAMLFLTVVAYYGSVALAAVFGQFRRPTHTQSPS